jgi:hypothetical protein
MKIKVYVDDLRKCPEGWTLARTNTDAIRLLHNQEVEEISIDHDICFYNRSIHFIKEVAETFKPIAYYLSVMPKEKRPQKVYLHSANPVGAHEMKRILEDAGIESEIRLSGVIYADEVLRGEYDS